MSSSPFFLEWASLWNSSLCNKPLHNWDVSGKGILWGSVAKTLNHQKGLSGSMLYNKQPYRSWLKTTKCTISHNAGSWVGSAGRFLHSPWYRRGHWRGCIPPGDWQEPELPRWPLIPSGCLSIESGHSNIFTWAFWKHGYWLPKRVFQERKSEKPCLRCFGMSLSLHSVSQSKSHSQPTFTGGEIGPFSKVGGRLHPQGRGGGVVVVVGRCWWWP